MIDLAKQAYDRIPVGGMGWIRPSGSGLDQLENFEAVVLAATGMQENRLILVQELHRESQTGRSFVDAIKFMRVV